MRKTLLTLTPAALLLLAVSGGAHAASNAQVVITGNVVAATCDVSASTSSLDLGNHTPSAFTAVATPVAASQKKFTVGINNCQTPVAANDTAGLIVNGATLGGNPTIFNTTGTNTGIMLSSPGVTGFITAGQKLNLATATATPLDAADFNGKALTFVAGLASSSSLTGVDMGSVNAPVTFQFAYN
jgi:major type 1 subunit fimbrin (pilin)